MQSRSQIEASFWFLDALKIIIVSGGSSHDGGVPDQRYISIQSLVHLDGGDLVCFSDLLVRKTHERLSIKRPDSGSILVRNVHGPAT